MSVLQKSDPLMRGMTPCMFRVVIEKIVDHSQRWEGKKDAQLGIIVFPLEERRESGNNPILEVEVAEKGRTDDSASKLRRGCRPSTQMNLRYCRVVVRRSDLVGRDPVAKS